MEEPLEAVDSTNEPHDHPLKGIGYMLAGVAILVALEMCAKSAANAGVGVLQVSWVRYVGHLLLFAAIFGPKLKLGLIKTQYPVKQVSRGVLLLLMTLASFLSLQYLQMIQVTVIGFLIPLVVAALSVPMLKEKVGPHRWGAIIIGFVGVMLVVRPTSLDTHWSMLVLMGGIFFYGFYMIYTKQLASKGESSIRSVFYTALIGGVILTLPMPFVWERPQSIEVWGYLAAAGILGGIGHFLVIKAHEFAPASLLAPFIYTQVIWSVLMGYLQFGDLPDHWTIIGGAIVISSGIYLMVREARKKKN
ncbi:DMT family transporter [Curvivirga aplysinae]|uniref:DMT family transporter n=1 Tax=Curvivirga aplysinae TaxID=2529852 RepID=UPI0012BB8D20|nr:DMT family transporter [Curvivirga aplysinae]MTI09145.1 DMT family transporter [Curvivirga aplysinae]